MKKQTKISILKSILAVVIAAVSFMPAYQAIAWGPERETFKWETAAPYRTMNSITDNPTMGDERNFVRVREVGDAKFGDEVNLEVGKEYEVEIYFHNNASRTLNASGEGIADGVRVNSILPDFVAKGQKAEISGTITAANTKPASVWDEAYIKANEDVYIRFVSDSAIIHSNGTVDGKDVGQQHLFSAEGANVGYWDDAWGVLPGCNEYSGYVSYKFRVDKPGFELEKNVSKDAANDWVSSVSVGAGDVVDFKIRYKNTGTTEQNNVILNDSLPDGLNYLQGTTFLINGSSPAGKFIVDDLFTVGINIGRYQPGSEAIVTYKARVADAEKLNCGSNEFTNSATVTTANGSMDGEAKVIATRHCEVAELPKTGPMEITLVVIAVMAIGIGGTYWWRSSRTLREARKAVGVGGVEKEDKE